jgi:hypothetical protein
MGFSGHKMCQTQDGTSVESEGCRETKSAQIEETSVTLHAPRNMTFSQEKSVMLESILGRMRRPKNVELLAIRLLVKRASGRKGCTVEVRNDQSITDLDLAIRRGLNYDTWDHCSAFFAGKPWRSKCLAEIYPDKSGPGQLNPISSLRLIEGVVLFYVYDFGGNLEHSVSVEEVLPVESIKQYPVVTSLSKGSRSPTK